MRRNLTQKAEINRDGVSIIPGDWFPGIVPANFRQGERVYLDSSWGFDAFFSVNEEAMAMGNASACYDRATFVSSGNGKIEIGTYTILNGCTLICNNHICIGNYVMIAWGAVISDNYLASDLNDSQRARLLKKIGRSTKREMPFSHSCPVRIGDNVWIGFDAVILPGTSIGRGSVIGCKSVVSGDIPEYSVVAGNPGRVIKKLEDTDKFCF